MRKPRFNKRFLYTLKKRVLEVDLFINRLKDEEFTNWYQIFGRGQVELLHNYDIMVEAQIKGQQRTITNSATLVK